MKEHTIKSSNFLYLKLRGLSVPLKMRKLVLQNWKICKWKKCAATGLLSTQICFKNSMKIRRKGWPDAQFCADNVGI
jgi:hypothetical protein